MYVYVGLVVALSWLLLCGNGGLFNERALFARLLSPKPWRPYCLFLSYEMMPSSPSSRIETAI